MTAELTEREAKVYDRQLRVWGVETQKRLSAAKVLLINCTGLAAEVAKNITLAGVGSLDILDNTPSNQKSPGNFLIHHYYHTDDATTTVAQASVKTLQEMNPLIKVSSVNIPLSPEHLQQYNIVLLFSGTLDDITSVEAACMTVNVPFFTACCTSIYGWAFANLHKYSYDVEKKQESKDGSSTTRTVTSHSIEYPTWDAAMRGEESNEKGEGGGGIKKVKKISKVYLILRIVMEFEKRNRRRPTESDADIEEMKMIMKEQGLPDGAVDEAALALYCSAQSSSGREGGGGGEEMPAVNAVVGGILANAVLGAVSKKGEPLNNLFCFSLLDGMGMVETVGHV